MFNFVLAGFDPWQYSLISLIMYFERTNQKLLECLTKIYLLIPLHLLRYCHTKKNLKEPVKPSFLMEATAVVCIIFTPLGIS